jgi:hypothetical protein
MKRLLVLAASILSITAHAQSVSNVQFVNGLALPGNLTDLSGDTGVNGRVGYFSDIYYDRNRNEWWGLSDRGPGGGTLSYPTRVQRFTVDIDPISGAISNFQITQTVKFTTNGQPFDGLAPASTSPGTLGRSLDPEGLVVNPTNGNFFVSDEYGPSLYEFNRGGELVRAFTVPDNLVPKVNGTANYVAAPPTLTTGREPNRGFEGLAISPDGKYAYAMLQNGAIQDGWTSANRGQYTRIVKFDTATGLAVAQYAYLLDRQGQGQGVSALVALGNDRFLVLERNNRGVGIGATLATADKSVYFIDLSTASDVSGVNLPATGSLPNGAVAVNKGAKIIDLDVNTLAALGNKSPEKWEGLAVGPQLANGKYLFLAGTDNDYSVTQNGSNTQFDVYLRFSDTDPYAGSIQCPVGQTTECFTTATAANATPTPATLTPDYQLLPGVLHAYVGDLTGYVAPIPEPSTYALLGGGLGLLGWAASRRRKSRA